MQHRKIMSTMENEEAEDFMEIYCLSMRAQKEHWLLHHSILFTLLRMNSRMGLELTTPSFPPVEIRLLRIF